MIESLFILLSMEIFYRPTPMRPANVTTLIGKQAMLITANLLLHMHLRLNPSTVYIRDRYAPEDGSAYGRIGTRVKIVCTYYPTIRSLASKPLTLIEALSRKRKMVNQQLLYISYYPNKACYRGVFPSATFDTYL